MKWIIEHNGKQMYLDYETDDLMDARPIIKSYHRYKLDYYVRKTCLGIYEIYCEKQVWNPVGHVDL
jgi:hypothetical protein